MYIKSNCFIIAILMLQSVTVFAQPEFLNKTRQLKQDIPTRSVMPGTMTDVDGDLVDDLMILDRGIWLKSVISHGKHTKLQLKDSVKVAVNPEWTMTSGDLNNDGNIEILTSGVYNLLSIFSYKKDGFSKKVFQSGVYAQASNTVDINNDGWLDYFVCNDEGPNRIFMNDKSGNLVLSNIIDFKLNDPTDGSGNYGSIWTDANGDLLPDLCISKCRAGVNDVNDMRRINRLYINKGNAVFEEEGSKYGLNSGAQSWVTAFGDIDNDGDYDAFVVNHYAPHILLENVEGRFFREIPLPETIQSFGFQCVMKDFDNDGWLDILMGGVEGTVFLHNQGNTTFNIIRKIIGPNPPRSLTVGDINDDGFIDVHAHISEPINALGVKDDELWLNSGNQNHFIKINLKGFTSNSSGIGAQLELYGAWGKQFRYVSGGESYGIFNSLQQHFGLAGVDKADSLIIRWPSGIIDKYFNLEANKTYFAQEGKCMSPSPELYAQQQIIAGTPIQLNAPPAFSAYAWSTGETTPQISVFKEGKYVVTLTDAAGCITISKPVSVVSGCFAPGEKLIKERENPKICAGETIELFAVKAASYQWSNGSTEQSVSVSASQSLSLTATDFCGNVKSDSVRVTVSEISLQTKGDTVLAGNTASLSSTNAFTVWYADEALSRLVGMGQTLLTDTLTTTTKYYARATEVIDEQINFVGEKLFPLSNLYGANSTSGGMIFNVEKTCLIYSVQVNTDTAGIRRILIKDKNEKLVYAQNFDIQPGIQRLILNVTLQPGQYSMSTDEETNSKNLGYKSPRLVRTFNNTKYPYTIDNVLSILSSPFGAVYYYYFYNWEVHFDIVTCNSEVQEVVAFVEKDVETAETETEQNIGIFPNPVMDNFFIRCREDIVSVSLTDINANTIKMRVDDKNRVDMSFLPPGFYVGQVFTGRKSYIFKIIKN